MTQMQHEPQTRSAARDGAWDVLSAVVSWRLWAFMGLQDIRQRYRRSIFGPLWLALGLGATIIGIGILYSQILKVPAGAFLPFLAISLLAWNFLSGVMMDSTSLFQFGSGLITSVRFPYTTLVLRSITRNLIVMAHCLVPVIITLVLFRFQIHPVAIASLAGLVLLIANMYWISLAVGMLCARFRDVAQIVIYGIQLLIFITPIIWQPSQVRKGSIALEYNPFYHLIQIFRAPIYDGLLPVTSFLFCTGMFVIGGAITFLAFARFRRDIVHWL